MKQAAEKTRIGLDLGGTKIEGVLLSADGAVARRERIPTPSGDYRGILEAVRGIVGKLSDGDEPVGVCTPGAVSPRTGLLKNSNSVCLNGMPFKEDLEKTLERPVRIANDANCLALSEATDGAAAGAAMVFAVILGTGVGGGISAFGKVHDGGNAVGGEWGHNPLPWMTENEWPGPECYCGKRGCIETFVSGTGLENDYHRATGNRLTAAQIEERAAAGDAECEKAIARYEDRLARGLLSVAHALDPDVMVLGGGMSNMLRLYDSLPGLMRPRVFGGDFDTPIRRAMHGDSSGVRGAAWLW